MVDWPRGRNDPSPNFLFLGPNGAYLYKAVQEMRALDENTPGAKPAKKKMAGPTITKKTAVVGAAIGIGSAAIVAALLYANRNNKS